MEKGVSVSRFDYVKYDEKSVNKQSYFKNTLEQLAEGVEAYLKPGRAQSLVLTKLEEAYMWIGKAIRDEQVTRNSETLLNEQRG